MNENRPDVNTRPYCENVTRQRQELTAGVSGTDIKHSTQCIQKAMEEQARRIPEAVALISAGKEMNYGELDRRANQIAWRLQELGVRPEVLVGICMERSMEMVVSLLGILKAGGAYVPLDPDYPEERLSYMTKDAGVRVQLTQGRLRERIGRYEGKQICVDEEWEELGKKSNHSVESGVSSENLAYVIYTSGSTGKPKGVLVTRAGLHNHLRWMQKEFPLDRGDRILQKTPLSFDVSAWEIFGPLLHGASLVMAEPGGHQDPAYLVSCIQEERITVLQLVPMQLQMILEQPHCGRCVSLKRVYCGGEPMSRELAAAISSRLPNVNLYNMYGPTETTIDATCCHHLGHDKEPTVPIGTPIANTQVFILDESMSPVPVGIKGELYIAGHGLARGYLNNPETTAACFIPNPFSTNAGERMYRTGDHGKWLPEGVIEFCGRSDHQLKIRGNRIELGEVESVLVGHDRIRQAAVVPRENHQGEKWLAGFVVLKDDLDKSFGEPQILNYLSARLPDYMVPIQITVLPGLPLTSNGKLDRAVLTQLSNDHAGAPRLCIEPATPMERILVESCADILAARPISVMSTFLEAGGTSLGAARLVTRIRELCNVNLLLRDLLGSKTLRQIALALDHQPPLPARDSAQVAESSKGETLAPASFSQERVWLIEQMDPSSVAYNFGARLVFDGDLNANALLHSLDAIVERHEIYRTTFTERQGHLYQVVHAPWHVDLRVIDVGGEAGQPDAIAKQDLQKTFDLTRLPLVRWKLLRIRSDKHVLLISEHHMVHDGWSFHLFLKDLTELYRFYTGGGPLRLSKPPMGFSDCARRQREWMNHPEAKEQLEYWKSALADAPPLLSLPYDHRRPSVQTYRGDVIKVELNRDLQDALLHTASRQRVTLFMLCAAAFQVLLFRYSGQEDFCIGTAVASRGLDGSEDVIGMFVNDVALRTPIEGNFTVAQVIAKMKQTAVEAYAHQEIPFQKIVEAVHPVRDPGYNPIFQAAFSFHDSPVECAPLKDLNLDIESGLANGSAKFDINVVIVPHQKQGVPASFTFHPEIAWEYNSDLFEGKIIRQMARHYIRLLEEITHDVGRRVSEVCIVTDEDVRQVVEIWNDTEMAFPNTKFIHEVFEDQVRKTPNSIAVVFEDVSLTYAELNARANQLAHYLRGLGVRPDVRVAVCMERGVEMIVGLLAILKAGGAYVPLDSSYPSERLQHMLADSAPIALLTQGHLQALFTDVRQTMPLLDLATAAPPWKTEPDMNLERADVGLTPENLVYVIYTSGSTGTPKGVLVAHQNLVSSTFARKVTYGKLGRFLLLSPLWFDSSVAGIFGTLTNGDTLIIVPQDVVRDSSLLGESIQHLRVDSLLCVPSLYQQLLEDCPADTHEKWLSKAIVAGEACSPWLVARSASKAPQTALFNEYGPTECTVWATVFRCKAQSVAQSVPIGHPITNSRVYILDGLHQPVPVGVAGELYIGGAGVARGYLNRPELTAERFQPNPFVQGAGTRMYRTGDLGRWLRDGTIEFLGRNDFQVKIRGYRIELGEIEARLAEHTGVREAVVIAREDSAGEKRLVAYYTCRCGNEPGEDEVGAEELRNHLSASLPEYMVPAAYVRLESLPLTANGKLDRNRLPLPTGDAYGVHGYEEPEGEMETVLAAIWAEVLTVERVGRHDNFFELGGHSLLAVRCVTEGAKKGLHFTLRDLFRNQTVAELTLAATEAKVQKSETLRADGDVIPITPVQEWFFEMDFKSPCLWNTSVLLHAPQAIRMDLLQVAIACLVKRHDALQLQFRKANGQWIQYVQAENDDSVFHAFDLSAFPEDIQLQELSRIASNIHASFDFGHGRLVRFAFFSLGERGNRVLIAIHHLLGDGMSLQILGEELEEIYSDLLNSSSGANGKVLPSAPSFIAWARHLNSAAVCEQALLEQSYWSPKDGLEIPVDFPAGDNTTDSKGRMSRVMPKEESAALLSLAQKRYRSNIDAILLWALASTIIDWIKRPFLFINIVGHSREISWSGADLSRMIGWLSAHYPLFLELPLDQDDPHSVAQVVKTLERVPQHGLGYGILRYIHNRKSPNQKVIVVPQPDVGFNYIGNLDITFKKDALFRMAPENTGRSRDPVDENRRARKLTLFCHILESQLHADWLFIPNLYRSQTIAALAGAFQQKLTQLLVA